MPKNCPRANISNGKRAQGLEKSPKWREIAASSHPDYLVDCDWDSFIFSQTTID